MKKQNGFSLVELSVVLSVIGVVMGGALTLATKKTEAEKLKDTENKIAIIEEAMNVYLTENQRLPCPAQGALAFSNSNFGKAGAASESANTGSCASADFSSAGVFAGVVPVKTLNLPDSVMIDGWGRRISYVIDARFANSITTNSDCDGDSAAGADHLVCFKYRTNGSIIIKDASGNPRTSTAVYALISHGKNGKGAWNYAGSATRVVASVDTDEQDNAGNDLGGSFNSAFVQKEETGTFDDVVSYRNKWQIMDEASTITDSDLCLVAKNGATSCTNANNTTACQAIATQVDSLCLDM